jgi:hypothetical protein
MSYDFLSWLAIALLIIGVVGLVFSILLDISSSLSKQTLKGLRGLFIVSGVIGALGLGGLVFGLLPVANSEHSSPTGINATGNNGILTSGRKGPTSPGQ